MTLGELKVVLAEHIGTAPDTQAAIEQVRALLHAVSPLKGMPVDRVMWVPIDMVTPNDYNPNKVAKMEMQLLLRSMTHDGITQPVVTIWNPERKLYEIIDGFHRYSVVKMNPEMLARTGGLIPIVVIDKPINDRMASTVRHNRARGKHSVNGMASMVFKMLDGGWDDDSICNELGMEPEEVLRLKHVTGFSKLFKDAAYNKAWVSKTQIRLRMAQQAKEKAALEECPAGGTETP